MKNHEIKRNALKLVEAATRNEVEKNVSTWIPHCAAIFHQPKRPKRK